MTRGVVILANREKRRKATPEVGVVGTLGCLSIKEINRFLYKG